MAAPLSPTRLFQCDGCGATLPVDEAQVGKKCRCGKCGKVLVVPGYEAEEDFSAVSDRGTQSLSPGHPAVAEIVPETVAFYCLKCDTRLVAYTKDVGKKAKCPDCGAKAVVPPPPKVKPKRPPRAMHGEQYGLWDVDEAPLPAELIAKQPKFYPVYCRVCDTLLQAHAGQVGKELKCPDCGAKTKVPPPPVEAEKQSVLVPEGEEYQLDEAQELPARPTYVPFKLQKLAEDSQREAQVRMESYERPVLPSIPLIQGVWRMLYRSPLPQVLFVFACMFALERWFVANAMANVTGMALMIVLVSYATTTFFGTLSLMAASAYWLAVLKESSEGNDRLHEPPGAVFLDWAGECFYLVFASSMAVAPGALAWRFAPHLPWWGGPAAVVGSWTVLFPVFLLSQLENGSSLEILSPKLLATLWRNLGPWLLFYIESAIVVASAAAATVALESISPAFVLLTVVLFAVASFLYFRLLGRLAWWLAELAPVGEEPTDQEK